MRFLKATTDIAFKKLFGVQKNSDLTISFLNSVLQLEEGKKITSVIINDTANHPETIDKKMSFVDVSCSDQANKKYIVEIQVVDEKNFIERAQYYAAVHLARQLNPKDIYQQLVPVIFIGVICFDLFEKDSYLSHYFLKEDKTGDRSLNLLEFHFIELNKFTKTIEELKTPLDKWSYLIKDAHSMKAIPSQFKTPIEMQKALHILEEGAWSDTEYQRYLAELDEWRGRESLQQAAHAQGHAEGEHQKAVVIARELLTRGMTVDVIAEITGLSIEEINQLK